MNKVVRTLHCYKKDLMCDCCESKHSVYKIIFLFDEDKDFRQWRHGGLYNKCIEYYFCEVCKNIMDMSLHGETLNYDRAYDLVVNMSKKDKLI